MGGFYMKDTLNNLQLLFTAIGGYLGYFLGGLDGFIYALVTFVVIDYITGIMAAIVERKLSSEIGFRGIFKKVLIFLLVTVGNIIDKNLVGTGGAVRTAVIFFYISNEGISVIENSIRIGLPVPEKLKNVLEQLQHKEEDN
jgi:toxin secretion/phage lysis holin